MKNKLIKRIVFGFICGALIGHIITFLFNLSVGTVSLVSPELLSSIGLFWSIVLQTLLSGLWGVAGFGGMCFYDVEKWGLLTATAVHFICIFAAAVLAFFVLQWLPFTLPFLFAIFLFVAVQFLIVWLIMYFKWKKNVRDMNENLIKYKEKQLNEKND